MSKRTCSVEGCPEPARTRGWCSMHYARWRKTGEVGEASRRNFPAPEFCTVEICDRPADGAKGWCWAHYQRWYLTGDLREADPVIRNRQPTILRDMSASEVAWVAGWLEGEGCFGVTNLGGYSNLSIDAKSIDPDVLEHIQKITGVGTVSGPSARDRCKPIWTYQVGVQSDVRALMRAVLPLMHSRRSEKIQGLLDGSILPPGPLKTRKSS